MSFRVSHLGVGLLLAALGSSGSFAPSARAQGTQRSTRELSGSETNTADIFRTLNQLGSKDDSLKRLDEELQKSSLPFATRRSLDGDAPLSMGPLQIPTGTTRRKKNDSSSLDGWLANPDSLMSGNSTEDFFGMGKSESDGKNKASWERIYQQLKQDSAGGAGLGSSVKAAARQPAQTQSDDDMPNGIKENADKLKTSLTGSDFGASIFGSTTPKSSFSDFFGIGATGLTPEQAKAHKAYMDKYVTSVFGDSSPAATLKSMSAPGSTSGNSTPSYNYNPLGTLPSIAHTDSPKPGSSFGSTLGSVTLPDMNANVLNQWNPLYVEPKIELPKPAPLVAPQLEVPRRRFF